MYVIEFQKRGLPHAHIVIFLENGRKIETPNDIDRVISAEIPDKNIDSELYDAVSEFMLHGPCGSSLCLINGQCSKHYPKEFTSNTIIHEDGYPGYKRPNDGRFIKTDRFHFDNRYVVP